LSDRDPQQPPLETIPTRIPGLDAILRGGFLRGGVYMVQGMPGAGKTILGNQLAFAHVAAGGRAVYLTMVSESHARMLGHLRALSFYDGAVIGDALYYVSGFQTLEEDGLTGLLDITRQAVRDHGATLLIIDGVATARELVGSDLGLRRFIQKLQLFLEAVGCTAVLLTRPTPDNAAAEHTMADGVIELRDERSAVYAHRLLTVTKFRGKDMLRGDHSYMLTDDGMVVYPRTDARYAIASPELDGERSRMLVGIPRLDEMMGRGLLTGTTTLLLGASGTGKTLLGLHFLATGAREGQQGLHFGFYETPTRLITVADRLGLGLGAAVAAGTIDVQWQPPVEQILDALAQRLLDTVERRRVRRLFIDGIDGFRQATLAPARFNRFLAALTNELRARDVTTVMSLEIPEFYGPSATNPIAGSAGLVENMLFLRSVELHSQLYRLISIMKMREGEYDGAIREFRITDRGIAVEDTFASAEAILTGVARSSSATARDTATHTAVASHEERHDDNHPDR